MKTSERISGHVAPSQHEQSNPEGTFRNLPEAARLSSSLRKLFYPILFVSARTEAVSWTHKEIILVLPWGECFPENRNKLGLLNGIKRGSNNRKRRGWNYEVSSPYKGLLLEQQYQLSLVKLQVDLYPRMNETKLPFGDG